MNDARDEVLLRDVFVGLRDKYAMLIALRKQHEAGLPAPPRQVLRALASDFPGALRELDQRSAADLLARQRSLSEYLAGAAELPDWAPLQARYHGIMRGMLALKRARSGSDAQGGGSQVCPDGLAAVAGRFGVPSLSYWDAARLAAAARPDKGRSSLLAARWSAEICGIPLDRALGLLFPRASCPDL